MRILIDMGHPAHVHFFRNAIKELRGRGHEVKITARDKDVTLQLLDAYGLEYEVRGTGGAGALKKGVGMVKTDMKMLRIAKKFRPDVMAGILNPYTAQISRVVGAKSITFTDTEHAKAAQKLTFPFTDLIVTPHAYLLDHGEKHVRYEGTHEMVYLNEKYFQPNPSILGKLGIKENEKFAFMRMVSWEASHDRNDDAIDAGFFDEITEFLEGKMRVVKSREITGSEGLEFHPSAVLDILSYAHLFLGDGATMAAEAAILGANSIYVSKLKGQIGVLDYLERHMRNYQVVSPEQETIMKLLSDIERSGLRRHERYPCPDIVTQMTDMMIKLGEQ
jgi:predicted glycosyltransferase